MPGVQIHNVELYPGKGGQMARAAGTSATLISRGGCFRCKAICLPWRAPQCGHTSRRPVQRRYICGVGSPVCMILVLCRSRRLRGGEDALWGAAARAQRVPGHRRLAQQPAAQEPQARQGRRVALDGPAADCASWLPLHAPCMRAACSLQ